MKLDSQLSSLPTVAGFIFTVLYFLIAGIYCFQKFQVFVFRKEYDIMMVEQTEFYDDKYVFDHD